jgi:uncharacterized protein YkwD
MGIADRDYMRERPPGERRPSTGLVFGVALVVLLVVFGRPAEHWLRRHGATSQRVSFGFGPLRGSPVPVHSRKDPWKAWLAPGSICPGREDASAPSRQQELAALCLVDYARRRQGLPPLPEADMLSASSAAKAGDIVRCDDFAHGACGRRPDAVVRDAGFRGTWGENIYAGSSGYATPLAAVDGWLNSPHHRENLFRRNWTEQGIALLHADELEGQSDVAVWVSEFGAP